MRHINYRRLSLLVDKLADNIDAKKYKGIYGIPRGGVPVAMMLANKLKLPVVDKPNNRWILVVDDLIDSGKTLARYPGNHAAVLFRKPHSKLARVTYVAETTKDWISFPWEIGETPAQDAVTRLIEVIGEDPNREGLLDTPSRVIKSFKKLYGGYKLDPKDILKTSFESDGYDQIVLLKDIEMYSTCEHHLLPFIGKAHVAYIPRKRVVGLSKLARLVECFSRRLQIQERLTQEVANALEKTLEPLGVAVVIEAQHFCMKARGVEKQNASMITSALTGLFKTDTKARTEFLRLIGNK